MRTDLFAWTRCAVATVAVVALIALACLAVGWLLAETIAWLVP